MARSSLHLGQRHAEVVHSAIQHWAESNTISQSQASVLADSIVVQGFDWAKFAKYSLRLAVLCLVVAVSSTIFEGWFKRLFKRIIELPPWLRSAATAVAAVGVHISAHRRSQRISGQKYANEAIHGVGAVLFALAALQLLEQFEKSFKPATETSKDDTPQPKKKINEEEERVDKERRRRETRDRQRLEHMMVQSVVLGLATIYGAVGVISGSNLIWSCSMIALGQVCGGMAGYASGTYWLYMSLPALFTIFGSFLIGTARVMRSYTVTAPLWSTTRIWGLLYFFLSLWNMSIFGADGYFVTFGHRGTRFSQKFRVFLWSVVFFVAAGGSIWHGLRYDDSTTKGFGLTFLGINLYTKLFEFGWGWSKPLFFSILAGTFAVIGRYAEDVWNLQVTAL